MMEISENQNNVVKVCTCCGSSWLGEGFLLAGPPLGLGGLEPLLAGLGGLLPLLGLGARLGLEGR